MRERVSRQRVVVQGIFDYRLVVVIFVCLQSLYFVADVLVVSFLYKTIIPVFDWSQIRRRRYPVHKYFVVVEYRERS